LAKALAISLFLHALLLGAGVFPLLPLSAWPTGAGHRLVGELRPAEATAVSPLAGAPVALEQVGLERKSSVRPARARGQDGAVAKPPSAPASTDAYEAVAAASLSAYRLTVARQARQFRQYPPAGRVSGVAAEVVVALRSLPGKPEPVVSLLRSSGNRQFDEAALSMIQQAVRLAPLPLELRGRRVQIELPVQFAPKV
jgi:TonB family protein